MLCVQRHKTSPLGDYLSQGVSRLEKIFFVMLVGNKKNCEKRHRIYFIIFLKLKLRATYFNNIINKIKWRPDECSTSDFSLNFYWWCLGY